MFPGKGKAALNMDKSFLGRISLPIDLLNDLGKFLPGADFYDYLGEAFTRRLFQYSQQQIDAAFNQLSVEDSRVHNGCFLRVAQCDRLLQILSQHAQALRQQEIEEIVTEFGNIGAGGTLSQAQVERLLQFLCRQQNMAQAAQQLGKMLAASTAAAVKLPGAVSSNATGCGAGTSMAHLQPSSSGSAANQHSMAANVPYAMYNYKALNQASGTHQIVQQHPPISAAQFQMIQPALAQQQYMLNPVAFYQQNYAFGQPIYSQPPPIQMHLPEAFPGANKFGTWTPSNYHPIHANNQLITAIQHQPLIASAGNLQAHQEQCPNPLGAPLAPLAQQQHGIAPMDFSYQTHPQQANAFANAQQFLPMLAGPQAVRPADSTARPSWFDMRQQLDQFLVFQRQQMDQFRAFQQQQMDQFRVFLQQQMEQFRVFLQQQMDQFRVNQQQHQQASGVDEEASRRNVGLNSRHNFPGPSNARLP